MTTAARRSWPGLAHVGCSSVPCDPCPTPRLLAMCCLLPVACRELGSEQHRPFAFFSFESMQRLCDKYNRAIDSIHQLVGGRLSPRLGPTALHVTSLQGQARPRGAGRSVGPGPFLLPQKCAGRPAILRSGLRGPWAHRPPCLGRGEAVRAAGLAARLARTRAYTRSKAHTVACTRTTRTHMPAHTHAYRCSHVHAR